MATRGTSKGQVQKGDSGNTQQPSLEIQKLKVENEMLKSRIAQLENQATIEEQGNISSQVQGRKSSQRKGKAERTEHQIAKKLELTSAIVEGSEAKGVRHSESPMNKSEPHPIPLEDLGLIYEKEHADISTIERETIEDLRQQLKAKSNLLESCQLKLKKILEQVRRLSIGVTETKATVENMQLDTSFAKSKRFQKIFTNCLEKLLAAKKKRQASQITSEEFSQGKTTPDSFTGDHEGKYTFESLLAYVESKERKSKGSLSTDQLVHNLSIGWNKPSGIVEVGDAFKNVRASDEKRPTEFEKIGGSSRKQKLEVRSESIKETKNTSLISMKQRIRTRKQAIQKPQPEDTLGEAPEVEPEKTKRQRRAFGPQKTGSYLTKRSRSQYKQLQSSQAANKRKEAEAEPEQQEEHPEGERNIMNITEDFTFMKPEKKPQAVQSRSRRKMLIGRSIPSNEATRREDQQ